MTNIPYREGDRFACFVVEKPDRGWGGPWGQTRRPAVWRCVECGQRFDGMSYLGSDIDRLVRHHKCGHAPCAYCGRPLLRRKDGSPRQHASNKCPGKNAAFRIEREFVKHITTREYQ